jgi:ABC-type nickel/cobalt efflux system permease component RcnA
MDHGIGGLVALTLVHWLCDLLWLGLISVLVYRTHALWGRKLQEWMFIGCSLLLAGFGAWYLVSGIMLVF